MKLAGLCCTYLRPKTLCHLIESFLRQDYPQKQRELLKLGHEFRVVLSEVTSDAAILDKLLEAPYQ